MSKKILFGSLYEKGQVNPCCTDDETFLVNPLAILDSTCINLTGSGTTSSPIQADVIISPADGNILECTEDGLYVPASGDESQGLQDVITVDNILDQTNTIDILDNFQLIFDGDVGGGRNQGVIEVINTETAASSAIVATSAGQLGAAIVGLHTALNGSGVRGEGQYGLYGVGTSVGAEGHSDTLNGVGVVGSAGNGGHGGYFSTSNNTTTTFLDVLNIERGTSGTAAAGIGSAIVYNVAGSTGPTAAGRMAVRWTDPTFASRSARFELYLFNNTAQELKLTISHLGKITLGTVPADYADNAAALGGGLTAGDIYRTTDVLKVVH